MKHGAQDFKEKLDMFVCGDIKYKAYQGEKNMISLGVVHLCKLSHIYTSTKRKIMIITCVCVKREYDSLKSTS